MKKILFLLFFAVASMFATELKVAKDYPTAVEMAKKDNKNIYE